WLLGGTFAAALSALLWGGLVRIWVLHHAPGGVHSPAPPFGPRPFAPRDPSTNDAALAVLSFGESWHNGHPAFPRSARHGLLPLQYDSSALLIRGFERLSWVAA